ncbi:hypothetical protein SEVIR_1G056666v4 [Setaria viridis]
MPTDQRRAGWRGAEYLQGAEVGVDVGGIGPAELRVSGRRHGGARRGGGSGAVGVGVGLRGGGGAILGLWHCLPSSKSPPSPSRLAVWCRPPRTSHCPSLHHVHRYAPSLHRALPPPTPRPTDA